MKTFVPFAGCSFEEGVLRSLMCLDDKRLGKQRVETYQVSQTEELETNRIIQ